MGSPYGWCKAFIWSNPQDSWQIGTIVFCAFLRLFQELCPGYIALSSSPRDPATIVSFSEEPLGYHVAFSRIRFSFSTQNSMHVWWIFIIARNDNLHPIFSLQLTGGRRALDTTSGYLLSRIRAATLQKESPRPKKESDLEEPNRASEKWHSILIRPRSRFISGGL